MFKCELCEHVPEFKGRGPRVQPPRTRAVKVPIELRPTEYPSRPKANKLRVGRKSRLFDDPGGAGYEISREVLACPTCAQEFETMSAERGSIALPTDDDAV